MLGDSLGVRALHRSGHTKRFEEEEEEKGLSPDAKRRRSGELEKGGGDNRH